MAELKNLKKGDTVILHMFTGIAVGVKEVLAADAKTVTLETRVGTTKFSKKTGIQVEPKAKSDRFANFITEDDGSFVPTPRGKKKADEKPAKKSKKAEPVEEPEEEEEEEEKPVKKTKKAVKPATKKSKKSEPEPEDEEEEDDEEDDEDYEEVE